AESNHESGLDDHHCIEAPPELHVKKDSMKDLSTIFLDLVTVQFTRGSVVETVKGRWCLVCKADDKIVKSKGLRKTFFTGSNSSCHQHICQHYELYKKWCEDAKIPLNHRAIPLPILKGIKAGKDPK
ncbi:hypothetical protein L208DRAFT_1073781, partial [Tricholoma matsutake]